MTKKVTDLETLLPHRAPMLLLNSTVDYGADFAQALVHIDEHTHFFDHALGGVPAWVGMEYMAQTIGIWAGHQHLSQNKPVQAGFLLGSRRYTCNVAVFPVGCTLQLSAKPVYTDDSGIGAFDCTILSDNIVATAQIKAFRPEHPQDFVRPFSQKHTVSLQNTTGATA